MPIEKETKSYKVCVYAICKNEEKFVDRWMDSMSEADMVVVTDTGSEDGTVEKLRAWGAVVHIEKVAPWRFDTARNRSLGYVPDDADICVCTDLDEVFEPGWREKLETAWRKSGVKTDKDGARQGRYNYNWSFKTDGTPDVQFIYSKIHSRHGFRWYYPVHEYIHYEGRVRRLPNGGLSIPSLETRPLIEVSIDGMTLNHYPDPTKSRGSYLGLLELAVQEEPFDDRMCYYLGREYMYVGQWKKCIETLNAYLSLPTATWREERCAAMRWIAHAYQKLGLINESYGWYYKAVAEMPHMREPYVEFAQLCHDCGDWPMTLFLAEDALRITEKSTTYINMGYAWDETPHSLSATAAGHMKMKKRALEHALHAVERSGV